jgi:hypothetical protein
LTDRREEISLAEELFAREREDAIAVHPAVGARIKQQIEERISGKRRSRMPLLWIPALASAIAGGWLMLQEERAAPELETLVRAHDRPVQMELAAGKRVELRPESALIPGLVPEVLSGEVEFRVAKLPPGESFRVRAAGVMVEVIGTVFTVRCASDRVEVTVEEGAVRVLAGGGVERVGAGERWSTPGPEPEPTLEPEPLAEPAIGAERAEAAGEPAELQGPAPGRVAQILAKSRRRAPRERAAPPAEAPPPEPANERAPDLEQEQKQSLLALAAWRLKNGDLDGARSIYRQLSETDALGLYLLARLEAQHAKRPDAALKPLEEFLARFADHALAKEARASRIEALLDLSQCEEAGRALVEFAGQHAEAEDLIVRSRVRHRSECRRGGERSPSSGH